MSDWMVTTDDLGNVDYVSRWNARMQAWETSLFNEVGDDADADDELLLDDGDALEP